MQSTHSDGQWRLPDEVLKLKYHPLLGWGKVSHSGYHFIDMAAKMVKDSFKEANKRFDEISVFTKFIRPSGLLLQQNQKDLQKIFGEVYLKKDSKTDNELLKLYKEKNEALEVIIGERKPMDTKSNILDHKMSVEIMSLIYKSGTSEIEVKEKYKD